jgi:LysM repeat protein
MRSAEQAQVSTIRHSDSRLLLMRVVMAVVSTLALLLIWRPVVLRAQEGPPAASAPDAQPPKAAAKPAPVGDTVSSTHVVKAGETLWSIATRYYGDGHQWRAVARRNGIPVSADSALRIGTKLVIPSKKTVIAAASVASTLPARTDTTTPKSVTTPAAPPAKAPVTTPELKARPAGSLAAQTGAKPATTPPSASRPAVNEEKLFVRQASHISVVSNADMRAARTKGEATTVFLLHTASADDAAAAARSMANNRPAQPRTAEFLAAPFVIAESQWVQMGRVMKRIDGATAPNPQPGRMHLADRVDITPPPGLKVSVGDRLMAVRPGGLVSEHVSVVVPTGILEVTNVGSGPLVRVHVRSLSGPLEEGQAVVPITVGPAPAGVVPTPSNGPDLETIVTWTEKGELLPTIESYAVIAAGDAEGVKAGDLFEFVRATEQGTEERLAIARVLRAGPLGSSLILTKQWRAGIQPGVKARRYAKMP